MSVVSQRPHRQYMVLQWGHVDLHDCANGSFVSNNNIFTILFFNAYYHKQINKILIAAFNETFRQSLDPVYAHTPMRNVGELRTFNPKLRTSPESKSISEFRIQCVFGEWQRLFNLTRSRYLSFPKPLNRPLFLIVMLSFIVKTMISNIFIDTVPVEMSIYWRPNYDKVFGGYHKMWPLQDVQNNMRWFRLSISPYRRVRFVARWYKLSIECDITMILFRCYESLCIVILFRFVLIIHVDYLCLLSHCAPVTQCANIDLVKQQGHQTFAHGCIWPILFDFHHPLNFSKMLFTTFLLQALDHF